MTVASIMIAMIIVCVLNTRNGTIRDRNCIIFLLCIGKLHVLHDLIEYDEQIMKSVRYTVQ